MLSTSRSPVREASPTDVAARATDAAILAANAAIRAADAAIHAANAAVRLIDEHDHRVIMLQPGPAPPRANRTDSGVILPLSPADLALRPKPLRRRLAPRLLALALIVTGALALLDVAVTLVWQEPLTALYAQLRQDHLSGALAKIERSPPTPVERQALVSLHGERTRIAFLAGNLQRHAGEGSAVGRIRIPRIGVNFVVVKGTSTAALEGGPGIDPDAVFPGIAGTTLIAGHRTTYLAPFRHVDELRAGNAIVLSMPYAQLTYTVLGSRIVAPTAVRTAVANVGYTRLVLSACTPLFSAAKRLLVFARLTSTVPAGAALPVAPRLREALAGAGGGVAHPPAQRAVIARRIAVAHRVDVSRSGARSRRGAPPWPPRPAVTRPARP